MGPEPDASRPRGILAWVRGLVARAPFRRHSSAGDSLAHAAAFGTPRSVNRTTTISFATPCRADSYEFPVEIECCWCASGEKTEGELQAKIDSYLPVFDRIIRRTVREEARKHRPHRPETAELAINAAIAKAVEAELAKTPDVDGVVLNVDVAAGVGVVEPVRQIQREMLATLIRAEATMDVSEMMAERLGQLRICWREFIGDGQQDWFTPYAVHLAQDPGHAAQILFAMADKRREDAKTFLERVATIERSHETMDLLEFAVASDTALRRTYELFGIPIPDAGPESPFDDAPKELP